MGIVSIVLGAILVVTGIGTFAGIMLIAGGIYSLAFAPKTPDQEAAQAQELNVATSSVGHPVPVVFGEVRMTPNFMDYSDSTFRSVEVKGEKPGKGGGDAEAPTLGFDYYLQWEYGICMGPVDAIGAVHTVPGEVLMHEGGWTTFSIDYMELSLDDEKSGGVVRIYRGADDQTRIASGDSYQSKGMNYRNVCWALVGVGDNGYKMGQQPTPPTLQFEIRRLPKPTRDDLTTPSIRTRGSFDSGHPAYTAANPAAIVYELLTNKVWGRGLSAI